MWFEDECHFQQHGSRCVMWVPPEDKDPTLLHAPTRKNVGIIGAVRPADGKLVTSPAKVFDEISFLEFLMALLPHRRRGRRMIVVLDNARWHHSIGLEPWLYEHRERIRLVFLPPYSPELNPIERVWKLTRRLCTHNRYFPTLDELVDAVTAPFPPRAPPTPPPARSRPNATRG
ncbi:MAG: IS630 family transposase [Deltaproteobacteria bacterium]|nr:IS630 family transposase [Deltaproteobacteria bacterium]